MEVLSILIIVAVVGYLIYESLPNTKFEKAQNLYNAKDYVQAINILNEIFDKHVDSPVKIAECKLELGKQASNKIEKLKFFNEVIEIRKKISNSSSIIKFDSIDAKALFEIADIQYEETRGDIDKLNRNIRFIDTANKKGSETDFNTLRTKHFKQLSVIYFGKAIAHERSNKYQDAIQDYKKVTECSEKGNDIFIKLNSIARLEICNLKQLSLEYN